VVRERQVLLDRAALGLWHEAHVHHRRGREREHERREIDARQRGGLGVARHGAGGLFFGHRGGSSSMGGAPPPDGLRSPPWWSSLAFGSLPGPCAPCAGLSPPC